MGRKLKVFLLLAVTIAMIFISAFPASADKNNGWYYYKGTYYYMQNGVAVKGWQKIGGNWYYFDEFMGAIQTGWLKYGNNYYYFSPTTGALKTGWLAHGGNWYYFSPATGALQTGWVKSGGNWYYFNPSTGALQIGWVKYAGNWYYTSPSTGAVVIGWFKIGRDWYHFDETTGILVGGKAFVLVEPAFDEEVPITVPGWVVILECNDCDEMPTFTGVGETEEEALQKAREAYEPHNQSEHAGTGSARYEDSYEIDIETGEYETVHYEEYGYYEEWIFKDGKAVVV